MVIFYIYKQERMLCSDVEEQGLTSVLHVRGGFTSSYNLSQWTPFFLVGMPERSVRLSKFVVGVPVAAFSSSYSWFKQPCGPRG